MSHPGSTIGSSPSSTTGISTLDGPGQGRPRVVIVGAGFAGLSAAKALADRPGHPVGVDVMLVDQHNYHVFTPFLYQVATALLEPSGAAHPIRGLIRKYHNVEFRVGRITGVNVTLRQVDTDHGPIPYDYLILAAGAVNDYFHNADIAGHSLGLNDVGEALALRNHLLGRFEAAAWASDETERARLLTFAVVGGGPTGVEFAAALAVLIQEMAGRDFPEIAAGETRIVLVEASDRPLGSFAADLGEAAQRALTDKGVQVESTMRVADVDEKGLTLEGGRRIEAATVVWAAGVRANPLAGAMPATGTHGRAIVGPTLQIDRHPDIFVVGDMAQIPGTDGPLPMLAQVALQSGRHAARSVLGLCAGTPAPPFRYRDLGTMATVGRGDAVAQVGRVHLSGFSGWLAWLGLHIVRTAGLQAKASVMLDWVSGFVFTDRPVRLIAGPDGGSPGGGSPGGGSPGGSAAGATAVSGGSSAGATAVSGGTAGVPSKADLPSVNVSNANRWGRIAALAWWSQSYPGLRKEPEETGHRRRGRRGPDRSKP